MVKMTNSQPLERSVLKQMRPKQGRRRHETRREDSKTATSRSYVRLKVHNQRCVLQAHGVTADGVVNDLGGAEGRPPPVQEDGGRAVGLGIEMVGWRWRRHHAISDS